VGVKERNQWEGGKKRKLRVVRGWHHGERGTEGPIVPRIIEEKSRSQGHKSTFQRRGGSWPRVSLKGRVCPRGL